jgi:hypothetical protein
LNKLTVSPKKKKLTVFI